MVHEEQQRQRGSTEALASPHRVVPVEC
jgi:hypothetical protein